MASPGVVETFVQSKPTAPPLIQRPPSDIGFSVRRKLLV
jgi:hypothetical protein